MAGRRISLGGKAVSESLARVGFNVGTDGVALVETVGPWVPLQTLLVQSAWNFIPRSEFLSRLDRYPTRMRQRALARRALAAVNARRAERIVCLTEAMADLVRATQRDKVEVSPVTVPLDAFDFTPARRPEPSSEALVPGTVTWYKEPLGAVDWLADNATDLGIDSVRFVGPDDGSGCLEAVRRRGAERGLRVSSAAVERHELIRAMSSARVVVLPSSLESLGFSVAEALMVSSHVVASALPAHVETARRLGREPHWLPASAGLPQVVALSETAREPQLSRVKAEDEWSGLGRRLGLRKAV